ncbi:hypothetical protein [Pseudoxanthomonas wuyuanensis]
MRTFRLFFIVQIAAVTSLLLVAAGMALIGAADSGPTGGAKFFFQSTLFFGIIPTVVVGAPIYSALLSRSNPRWLYVILLGIGPGVVTLPLDVFIGIFATVCGGIVASLTHVLCRRLGRNSSFKPVPLRGTA